MKLRVRGLDKLRRELKELPPKVVRAASEEMEATAADVDAKAVQRLSQTADTGLLKNHNGFEGKGLHWVIFNSAGYAGFHEFGTKTLVDVPPEMREEADKFRASKGGNYEEFRESIAAWMKRRGIPAEALYPIMAKILRIGIAPHPFMYNSFKEATKGLEKRIDAAIQRELNKI